MAEHKHAIVVGALGVIGRYIVARLLEQGDWSVAGLSRRTADAAPRYRHIAVDLLDADDTADKLAGLRDVTHVFYAAFQPAAGAAAGYASNIAPNRDMLINAVTAIDRASSALRRVVLVTGTKYYGSHLGPYRTPARESDPRHTSVAVRKFARDLSLLRSELPNQSGTSTPMISSVPSDPKFAKVPAEQSGELRVLDTSANYYFDQIDWLSAFPRDKRWDWVELRPQTLCGFAPGTPMSLAPAIAVYAAISKELGRPLHFPGKPGAYASIYQVTASEHFANAALWAANEPRCGREAFNITNGDYFRWKNLWPKLAAAFDMPSGDVRTTSLTADMADKAPLWRTMTEKHGLKPYAWEELVAWPFVDYVFGCDWDVMSDVTKSRRFGFHDVVDSEEMFVRLMRQFRAERIVP